MSSMEFLLLLEEIQQMDRMIEMIKVLMDNGWNFRDPEIIISSLKVEQVFSLFLKSGIEIPVPKQYSNNDENVLIYAIQNQYYHLIQHIVTKKV